MKGGGQNSTILNEFLVPTFEVYTGAVCLHSVGKMAEGGGGVTPTGLTPRFEGFRKEDVEDGRELNYRLQTRKIQQLEEMVENMRTICESFKGELESVRGEQKKVTKELIEVKEELKVMMEVNGKLKEENKSLNSQLNMEMTQVKKINEEVNLSVRTLEKKQSEWIKESEVKGESLRKIIEDQQKEKEQGIKEKVISVIKEKQKLVRDTVDKIKCVVIFGVKEEKIVSRLDREEKEKEEIHKILTEVTEEPGQAANLIEEFYRIGKFEEGKDRPLRIKFATQVQAEEVINGSWKLAGKEELKGIWINKDLNEEERKQLKDLVIEAKQKNEERTEEEKKQFYWKVRDLRLRKKYIRK